MGRIHCDLRGCFLEADFLNEPFFYDEPLFLLGAMLGVMHSFLYPARISQQA
jgi:hypothetical protein